MTEDNKIPFEKSFASHEKAKYWSEKNELKPENIKLNYPKKAWFNCDKCKHNFEQFVYHVVSNNIWCPYCPNKKLCENNNCIECFNKSFASHEKVKYWSDENIVLPRNVFKLCRKKYIFKCDKCEHSFKQYLNHVNNGVWCPFCSNKKMCYNENCIGCFNKSYASHIDAVKWSIKNIDKPRNVFKVCYKKFIFDCNKCNNDYEKYLSNNTGCPLCVNKTETTLYEYLSNIYTNIIHQYKVYWCKKIRYLPYDFCIEENKIIIELDRRQHFEQVRNWSSPEEQFENDKYKQKYDNENVYYIIRLLQEDVFNNKYDWKTELINNIEKIKTDDIIQNIYMCKNNEYENFIN